MKFILFATLLISSSLVHAANFDEAACKSRVRQKLGTFGVCADHTKVQGDDYYSFSVSTCQQNADQVTCVSKQNFPSSSCEQEIYMDLDCQFNKGAKITKDSREDI